MRTEKQGSDVRPQIHVILACHNRRALTLRALGALYKAAELAGSRVDVTVFDDGSSDGSASAIQRAFPEAQVILGDGSAFWARSMAVAEATALGQVGLRDSDLLVWLNDDVALDADSITRVHAIHDGHPNAVLVGAMRDPSTAEVTYSGLRRAGRHPLRFDMVPPSDHPVPVHTFNGNFVIVPVSVIRNIGGIDGGYSHAFADIDYGVRCTKSGTRVLLMNGTFGTCPRNPPPARDTIAREWERFTGPKGGGNFESLTRYLKKTSRRDWWVWACATYVAWWARVLGARLVHSTRRHR